MRCLALAAELTRQGAQVTFFSQAGSAGTAPALARSGLPVRILPDLLSPILGEVLDALVVDHYGLSAPQETGFRDVARLIVVIDDLADRLHDCDILLDTTAGRCAEAYAALAPGALCLMGAQHALLRPAFASLRPRSMERHAEGAPLRRILVSFGLTDAGGVTAPAAETLLASVPGARIDVVVRKGTGAWSRLEGLATRSEKLFLHDDPSELAELMADADLAVGAGGVTSWERCCLGLPAIVAQLADNQHDNIAALTVAGAALALVDPRDMDQGLTAAVGRMADPAARRSMSEKAGGLCDGEGARRVADTILRTIDAKPDTRRSS